LQQNRFYYWELDFKTQKLRLKTLIHEDLRGKIIYLQEEIPFGQGRLIEQLRLPFLSQKLLTIPLIVDLKLAEFIRRQLYYCSPKWLKLQEKYYQRGENLDYFRSYFCWRGTRYACSLVFSSSSSKIYWGNGS